MMQQPTRDEGLDGGTAMRRELSTPSVDPTDGVGREGEACQGRGPRRHPARVQRQGEGVEMADRDGTGHDRDRDPLPSG